MNTLQVSILSLLIAQLLKIFTTYPPDISRIIGSGGFPSSHAAFVSSLATTIGLNHGFYTDIFAITTVFSLVVIYDASGVRRAVGEQANVLNNIISHFDLKNNLKDIEKEKEFYKEELKELIGHTPVEVISGIILGILIALANNIYLI